ncbi:hypothetical protein [Stenotrophomonas phage SOVA965]
MSKVDSIDNAANLLAIVGHYMGKDSATYREVADKLKEGFSASEIAEELRRMAKEAWSND